MTRECHNNRTAEVAMESAGPLSRGGATEPEQLLFLCFDKASDSSF